MQHLCRGRLRCYGVTSISHRQDDTELRVAAHHARVGFGGLLQGIGFDHRPHAGELGEANRVLGVGRGPRVAALDAETAQRASPQGVIRVRRRART